MTQKMYFLISVSDVRPNRQIPKTMVLAFFSKKDDAIEALDLFTRSEHVPYRHIVLEEAQEGIKSRSRLLAWFEADASGRYKEADTPLDLYVGVDSYLRLDLLIKGRGRFS